MALAQLPVHSEVPDCWILGCDVCGAWVSAGSSEAAVLQGIREGYHVVADGPVSAVCLPCRERARGRRTGPQKGA